MFSSGWAKITKAGDSTLQWFKQQITYRGKVSDCIIVSPYGFHSNAKINNSLVLFFGVGGDASNKAGIAFDPNIRPDLKEGEVAVYVPGNNTLIKLSKNNIEVIADSKVTVTTPEVELSGNATIKGDLAVEGATALSATVTSNGKDISDTHAHVGSPTAPVGSISNTGAPV